MMMATKKFKKPVDTRHPDLDFLHVISTRTADIQHGGRQGYLYTSIGECMEAMERFKALATQYGEFMFEIGNELILRNGSFISFYVDESRKPKKAKKHAR